MEAASSSPAAGSGRARRSAAQTRNEARGGGALGKLDPVDDPIKGYVCRTIGSKRRSLGGRHAERQLSQNGPAGRGLSLLIPCNSCTQRSGRPPSRKPRPANEGDGSLLEYLQSEQHVSSSVTRYNSSRKQNVSARSRRTSLSTCRSSPGQTLPPQKVLAPFPLAGLEEKRVVPGGEGAT